MADIIYVLTNPSMPNLVKIGRTSSSVEQRMRELDNTTAPLPFKYFFAGKVENGIEVEKKIHIIFGDQRVRKNREFFRVDPNRVRTAIELVLIEDVTPKRDLSGTEEDLQAVDDFIDRRPPMKFSMVKVPIGAELSFARDEKIKCRVVSDRQIEFEGQITSLSAAALILLKRDGWRTSHQIQGPLYWLYEGEPLSERRLRIEETEDRQEQLQKCSIDAMQTLTSDVVKLLD